MTSGLDIRYDLSTGGLVSIPSRGGADAVAHGRSAIAARAATHNHRQYLWIPGSRAHAAKLAQAAYTCLRCPRPGITGAAGETFPPPRTPFCARAANGHKTPRRPPGGPRAAGG